MSELTEQDLRAMRAIEDDWAQYVKGLVLSTNSMLGTSRAMIEGESTEVLVRMYEDMEQLSEALAEELAKRNGKNLDSDLLKDLADTSSELRSMARKRFNQRFETSSNDEKVGMYL